MACKALRGPAASPTHPPPGSPSSWHCSQANFLTVPPNSPSSVLPQALCTCCFPTPFPVVFSCLACLSSNVTPPPHTLQVHVSAVYLLHIHSVHKYLWNISTKHILAHVDTTINKTDKNTAWWSYILAWGMGWVRKTASTPKKTNQMGESPESWADGKPLVRVRVNWRGDWYKCQVPEP